MFTAETDRSLGLPVVHEPYPDGEEGIQKSIKTICTKIREGMTTAVMKSFAGNVLKQANALQSGTKDRAIALSKYVHQAVGYAPDALGSEQIQSAAITLCVEGAPICIPIEDCDGLCTALGTLCGAAGMDVQVVRQFFGGGHQQHVLLEVKLEDGSWYPLDPSNRTAPYGVKAPAQRETRHSPFDSKLTGLPDQAQFVGMGALPVWAWKNERWNLMPENATLETGLGHAGGACCAACASGKPCESEKSETKKNLVQGVGLSISDLAPQIAWIGQAWKIVDPKGRDFGTALKDARARAASKDWSGNPSALKWELLALIVSSVVNAAVARTVPSLGEWASNSLMHEWVLLARQLGYDNQSAKDFLDKLKKGGSNTTAYAWAEIVLIIGAAIVGAALVAVVAYLAVESGERIVEYYLAGKNNEDERIRLHEEKNKIVERHLDGSPLSEAEKRTLDFDEAEIGKIAPVAPKPPEAPKPFDPWPWVIGAVVVGGTVLAVTYRKDIQSAFARRGGRSTALVAT